MLARLLLAWAMMAGCVAIHAAGLVLAMQWFGRPAAAADRFWSRTMVFVRLAGWIVALHLVEIAAWAMFLAVQRALPDLQSAFYFSGVTYTTTGYGDVVLPPEWRLVGAVEALTGILMCGWSTGFFFAAFGRVLGAAAVIERQR